MRLSYKYTHCLGQHHMLHAIANAIANATGCRANMGERTSHVCVCVCVLCVCVCVLQNPLQSPDWSTQTVFLATRGATEYEMDYCHAKDMVHTRVGFVLSSNVTVANISYQGVDTIRPDDNGE